MYFRAEDAGQGLQSASPVAAVLQGAAKALAQAVLADVPVPVEGGPGAEQPEIVHRLHHRHPLRQRRVIDRRADEIQGVVDVDDVDVLLSDQAPDIPIGFGVKNRSQGQQQLAKEGKVL